MDSDEDDDDDCPAVVVDNGSSQIRVGYSGEEVPSFTVNTELATKSDDPNSPYIGSAIPEEIRNTDRVIRPIVKGSVVSLENMETIWRHIFNQLGIDPAQYPILTTRKILEIKQNSEQMCQFLFETFNPPGIYLVSAPVLSLYASGRTTGVMVDCGYEMCQIAPVYEGYTLPHASKQIEIGGHHVTKCLQRLLSEKEEEVVPTLEECSKIKETLGCVAPSGMQYELEKVVCDSADWLIPAYLRSIDRNYCDRTSADIEKQCDDYFGDKSHCIRERATYKLPDGRILKMEKEHFECTELLFENAPENQKTQLLQKELIDRYLVASCRQSIHQCDVDIRKDLLGNVVLAGRESLFKGFVKRFAFEWQKEWQKKQMQRWGNLRLIAANNRGYSGWLGGSILASLSTFHDMWVTPEQYAEDGPSIIHRKCHD